jgi:hypothetical protein
MIITEVEIIDDEITENEIIERRNEKKIEKKIEKMDL